MTLLGILPTELAAARLRLATGRPYLAAALWAVVPVPKPGLGTLAVDKWWRLYFDPAVAAAWTVEQLAGVLYHEIAHLLRAHPERAEQMSAASAAWNLAADAEINDDLLAERVTLPGQPVTPALLGQPEGRLAEEYYVALQAQAQSQQAQGQGQQGQAQDWGGAGSAGGADPTQADPTAGSQPGGATASEAAAPSGQPAAGPDAGSAPSPDPAPPRPGAGRCGSCATGHQEPWEDPGPAEGGPAGISRAEAELIRRQAAQEIIRIAQSGRDRGEIPGHWRRWAEEKLRPRVDWRRELAAAIRHALADVAGAADYSYRRPSRRQGAYGPVVIPALRQPVPEVAVVVDTSGSMSDRQLSQALAEVAGVLQAAGQRQGVTVLAVDAAVQAARRVFRPDQVCLAGGGGTDMGVGIDAALQLRPRPQVVVVITDGYTPWPERPPGRARVIVALVGDGESPSWAKTIKVEGHND